jgi:predicted nuclease with RNAse H fold
MRVFLSGLASQAAHHPPALQNYGRSSSNVHRGRRQAAAGGGRLRPAVKSGHVKTLGVDLAAAAKKTAVAVIEWSRGSARLVHLGLDVQDQEIVSLFGTSDMTGVDCPVGWPDALIPFLAGHLAFDAGPVLDYDGIEGRRLLAYRDTDRYVTRRTGLIPLSVSADRLAHPAMRCAVIQAKIAALHGPQLRDGSGRLAEVYPAASLKLWGLNARGYKGRGSSEAERRAALLGTLREQAPWLDLEGYGDQLAASDDMFERRHRLPHGPRRCPRADGAPWRSPR